MTRRLSFCLLYLAATPTAWAQPACPETPTPGVECIVEGDSIGPDNTFTTELGGQPAIIDSPDFFGQPAVHITQNGTSLLEELRVIVAATPSTAGDLNWSSHQYKLGVFRLSDYLAGADPQTVLSLGSVPANITLVDLSMGGDTIIIPDPSHIFGEASPGAQSDPSYDFTFDLTQFPIFQTPLPADDWILQFYTDSALASGTLFVLHSSSPAGPIPYFELDSLGGMQHPRGIFNQQDPNNILFRFGINITQVELYPGDFDFNGTVNGLDFLLLQREPGVGSLADWEANYGMGAPLSATLAAVPEPTTCGLALAATLFLAIGRRRPPGVHFLHVGS